MTNNATRASDTVLPAIDMAMASCDQVEHMIHAAWMTAEAEIVPSTSIAPWTIRLPSLIALLRYQMWAEFGSDGSHPPAVSGFRSCANCGRSMPIGGRRGATYRVDAKYCSESCRVAYHQRKKRSAGAK